MHHRPTAVAAPSDSSPTCSPATCCWSRFAIICACAVEPFSSQIVILPFVCASCSSPHRLRGAGRVPAGVHLHDPHRRVHRRVHAPRALTPDKGEHTSASASSRKQAPGDARRSQGPHAPSAEASSTAALPSAPASASASSSATPSRPWPASPSPPAWCAPPCSSASRSPRRSRSSASCSRSSSRVRRPPCARAMLLAAVRSSPWSRCSSVPGAASSAPARDQHDLDQRVGDVRRLRGQRVHRKLLDDGEDGRRLPEGAEPDPAGEERAHLGRHLVRRRCSS